jgi:hypothetical protein
LTKDFPFRFYPIFERIALSVAAVSMKLVGALRDTGLQVVARGHRLTMNWFFCDSCGLRVTRDLLPTVG